MLQGRIRLEVDWGEKRGFRNKISYHNNNNKKNYDNNYNNNKNNKSDYNDNICIISLLGKLELLIHL